MLNPVAYLGGGPWCNGPLFGPTMKNFKATLYKKVSFLHEKVRFCRFPARIAKLNNVWWSFIIPIQYAIKIVMWDCIWYDAVIFCVSEFQKKMGEFAASIKHSKAKGVSASGGPRPGALPLGPRFRLALCALAMAPPLPNPKYATG